MKNYLINIELVLQAHPTRQSTYFMGGVQLVASQAVDVFHSIITEFSMVKLCHGNTSHITGLLWRECTSDRGFPSHRARYVELVCFLWCWYVQVVNQTSELSVDSEAMTPMWRHVNTIQQSIITVQLSMCIHTDCLEIPIVLCTVVLLGSGGKYCLLFYVIYTIINFTRYIVNGHWSHISLRLEC